MVTLSSDLFFEIECNKENSAKTGKIIFWKMRMINKSILFLEKKFRKLIFKSKIFLLETGRKKFTQLF